MTKEAQEIIEIWPADGFGPPVPIEGIEASFSVWQSYLAVLDWFLPALMVIGTVIILRFLIWESLRFNYYHYLEHGEFVFLWGDDGGNHKKAERRKKIATELKIADADFVSWFAALAMSLLIIILHLITALLWPITIVLVLPLGIVRLIGFRKRKKIAFTQKLKGEHLST